MFVSEPVSGVGETQQPSCGHKVHFWLTCSTKFSVQKSDQRTISCSVLSYLETQVSPHWNMELWMWQSTVSGNLCVGTIVASSSACQISLKYDLLHCFLRQQDYWSVFLQQPGRSCETQVKILSNWLFENIH